MYKSNLPPFHIGQKVICVRGWPGYWVKGNIYTVAYQQYCPKCGEWHMSTAETPVKLSGTATMNCTFCDTVIPGKWGHWSTDAKSFVPVEENFETISFKEIIRREKPITCSN